MLVVSSQDLVRLTTRDRAGRLRKTRDDADAPLCRCGQTCEARKRGRQQVVTEVDCDRLAETNPGGFATATQHVTILDVIVHQRRVVQ